MNEPESGAPAVESTAAAPARLRPRILKLVRRVHLYAGLFLLPWVFLYGITGAMFNHIGLFPAVTILPVPADPPVTAALKELPSAESLATQVTEAIRTAAPDAQIELRPDHGAAYNNDLGLETTIKGEKHVVRIDPVDRSAWIMIPPKNREQEAQTPVLTDVRNVRLKPDPHETAKSAVPAIVAAAGLDAPSPTKPVGWCKLNFLADIDGQPCRVTYVLRDGHVDITRHTGDDGMLARQFLLRLHTSHGRTPGWSSRNLWSLFVDGMAIAMVMWGVTGLVMWWQLKSIRLIGGLVILASILTAIAVCLGMVDFYATTKL